MDIHRGYAPHTTAPGSQTASRFGHADYHHALAQGKSGAEIAQWAQANTGVMGNGGVGGDLWNTIMANAGGGGSSGGGGGGGGGGHTVGASAGAFDPESINFNPGGIDMGFSESDYVMGLAKERAENFTNENQSSTGGNNNSSITNNIEQNIGNKGDQVTEIGDGNTINDAMIGNDYSLNMGNINLANRVGQY